MTRQKSFKTQVRARMDKTGESYTTARRQLLAKATSRYDDTTPVTAAPTAAPPEPTPTPEAVKALQFSDALVRERTGRGWDEWFALLDGWHATTRTHTEIARWLAEEQQVDGWWAQSVTVTYEQARGMRAPGQGADGYFTANASKTVAVPVERLFDAFADDDLRERWLPGAKIAVRTATSPKSFRADWVEDSTRIGVGFGAKSDAKALVAVAHEKLPDAAAAAAKKAYWRDRLAALKMLLEG